MPLRNYEQQIQNRREKLQQLQRQLSKTHTKIDNIKELLENLESELCQLEATCTLPITSQNVLDTIADLNCQLTLYNEKIQKAYELKMKYEGKIQEIDSDINRLSIKLNKEQILIDRYTSNNGSDYMSICFFNLLSTNEYTTILNELSKFWTQEELQKHIYEKEFRLFVKQKKKEQLNKKVNAQIDKHLQTITDLEKEIFNKQIFILNNIKVEQSENTIRESKRKREYKRHEIRKLRLKKHRMTQEIKSASFELSLFRNKLLKDKQIMTEYVTGYRKLSMDDAMKAIKSWKAFFDLQDTENSPLDSLISETSPISLQSIVDQWIMKVTQSRDIIKETGRRITNAISQEELPQLEQTQQQRNAQGNNDTTIHFTLKSIRRKASSVVAVFHTEKSTKTNIQSQIVSLQSLMHRNGERLKREELLLHLLQRKLTIYLDSVDTHSFPQAIAIQCVICFDHVEDTTAFSLPCGHTFHRDCVEHWFHFKDTCPLCNRRVIWT